jgi:hypothetical protein
MVMLNGQKILDNIKLSMEPHHDTVYCHERHKDAMIETLDSSGMMRVDNLRVYDLDIETDNHFTIPVVCQKGEVFPITEDFK